MHSMRRACGSALLVALLLAVLAVVSVVASPAKSAKVSPQSPTAHSSVGKARNSTLVSVQVVSRHGTRAPNPVVVKLCPADRANLALYAHLRITLAGLTGTGMGELYELGVFARQQYIERSYPGFLSKFFNDQEVYFRAVGEDRTLQSAAAMGQGMYPAGSAPLGYSTEVPSPIPIYTLPDVYDSLLEVRKQGCKATLARDAAQWDRTEGVKLYKSHQSVLQRLHELCNITDLNDAVVGSGDNYGDAIKDITDAWTFDMIEGFQMQPGINVTSLLEFRTLAVKQLLGRILGTDEQITYLNGELPERMLDNFLFSVWNQGPEHVADFALKMYAYHGHREMIYALAALLGIDFDIEFPALPKGAIPPATTLFFELHYDGPRDAQGNIPNAFEAAGMDNPYHNEEERADPLSDKSLPWELRRRSASDLVRNQAPQHDEPAQIRRQLKQQQEDKKDDDNKDSDKDSDDEKDDKQEDEKPSPSSKSREHRVRPGPLSFKKKSKDAKEGSSLFGSDQLSSGNGAPFDHNGTQTAPSPAESFKYKYLPRAPSSSASASQREEEEGEWRPAPPTTGYFVKALLWHPCADIDKAAEAGGKQKKSSKSNTRSNNGNSHDPSTPDCPATPIAMTAVCDRPAEEGCTLQELSDAIHKRIARTGTWAELCDVEDVRRIMADEQGVEQAAKAAMVDELVEVAAAERPRRHRRPAPPADSRTATKKAAEAPVLAAVSASPSAPVASSSHPLLRGFLILVVLSPLSLLVYAFCVRLRQWDYSPMDSIKRFARGRRATQPASVEVPARGRVAGGDEEESRPFVH